jgi:hypothetical protein
LDITNPNYKQEYNIPQTMNIKNTEYILELMFELKFGFMPRKKAGRLSRHLITATVHTH